MRLERQKILARIFMRELGWFSVYSALSIAMTWPLARLLDRAYSDPGDPFLNTWILHWDWLATFSEASLWHANIFHPARWTLAFSENLYGVALLTFPLRFAGLDPATTYNIAMIAGFALAGYGMHVLARTMLRPLDAGWITEAAAATAGVFFASVPYRFDHLAHLQHIWSGWLPLSFAALVVLLRTRRALAAAAFAAAYVMNGLSNIHWLLFSAVAVPLLALVIVTVTGRTKEKTTWTIFAAIYLLSNVLLLPFLVPYKIAAEEYGMTRGIPETAFFSAIPADWTVGSKRSNAWSTLNEEIREPERALFPGAVVLLLTLFGFLVRRDSETSGTPEVEEGPADPRLLKVLDWSLLASGAATVVGRIYANDPPETLLDLRLASVPAVLFLVVLLVRFWVRYPSWLNLGTTSLRATVLSKNRPVALWAGVALILLGVSGSLGLNAPFHTSLYSVAEPFRSLRVPARWAMIAYVGLGMTAAVGAISLISAFHGWKRRSLALVIPCVMIAELWSAPIFWTIVTEKEPPVYAWLRGAEISGGVLELPVGGLPEFLYVFRSTIHDRPIMNGISGFGTDLHHDLVTGFSTAPVSGRMIDLLEENEASLVIVHNDRRDTSESIRSWLRENLETRRLLYVGRLPHLLGHDYLFAVRRNEPSIPLLPVEDTGPVLEREEGNLDTFLTSNGITYIDATFGHIDSPPVDGEVLGDLTVSGWALSPHGIREIDLLFQNESVRIEAEISPAPYLFDRYPWYDTSRSRFTFSFQDRPKGVRQKTDLIVEIVDGRGQITRLPQRLFRWIREERILPVEIERWNRRELEALLVRLGHGPEHTDAVIAGRETIEDLAIAPLPSVAGLSDPQFVELLYDVLLGRSSDAEGLRLYTGRLKSGWSRERIIRTFIQSPEFRDRYTAR